MGGRNLVGTANSVSPLAPLFSLRVAQPKSGEVRQKDTSPRTGSNQANGGCHYALGLETQGGTVSIDYIGRNGYRDFNRHNKSRADERG